MHYCDNLSLTGTSLFVPPFTTRCRRIVRILRATATIALPNPIYPTFRVKNTENRDGRTRIAERTISTQIHQSARSPAR